MKQAVVYGAGNIGRGFLGQTFAKSGYEVCFIDVDQQIVALLNEKGAYTVREEDNDGCRDDVVRGVSAVDGRDAQAAAQKIAQADIMSTSVGVNIMPRIAPVIAQAVGLRMREKNQPLNIILAENQLDADKLMRGWIYEHLDETQRAWADENLGLVEASIGRMVPRVTQEQREVDPLMIFVEPYCELPLDSEGFKGEIPKLADTVPFTPFGFYIKRKLFIHNMGHAILAYFGYEKGYAYIWQAAGDAELMALAQEAMTNVATALSKEYGIAMETVMQNVYDLRRRFGNRAVPDPVVRVGADPIRKLRKDDRLVGAALYCLENGCPADGIVAGICKALKFDPAEDAAAQTLQQDLKTLGLDAVMEKYMGLAPDSALAGLVRAGV